MKKNIKQIVAIISLIAITVLILLFLISAFFTKPDSSNLFFSLFFAIIAIPILAWLFLFCYGRFKGEHTMAELFPNSHNLTSQTNISPNPENKHFTDEEITQAMENSQK